MAVQEAKAGANATGMRGPSHCGVDVDATGVPSVAKAPNEAQRNQRKTRVRRMLSHPRPSRPVANEARILEGKKPCRGLGATGNLATSLV